MNIKDIQRKLKLDKAGKILVINMPAGFELVLEGLNADLRLDEKLTGKYDFVQVFATKQSELEQLVKEVKDAGKYDCLFWISYPKGGGKIKSDIKRDTTWAAFALIGLRPVAQIAIDETWSALRGRPGTLEAGKAH
jgi:hypothetical protein